MNKGHFYFISDDFYTRYDQANVLMKNKDIVNGVPHNRPSFLAFPDHRISDVYWFVPISKQWAKFQGIYQHKLDVQINKGIKNPKCNTLYFGSVMGAQSVFLIQNMFPVIEKYVLSEYIDNNTGNAVTIPTSDVNNIVTNAQDVLRRVFHGQPYLIYGDMIKLYRELCNELALDAAISTMVKNAVSQGETYFGSKVNLITGQQDHLLARSSKFYLVSTNGSAMPVTTIMKHQSAVMWANTNLAPSERAPVQAFAARIAAKEKQQEL